MYWSYVRHSVWNQRNDEEGHWNVAVTLVGLLRRVLRARWSSKDVDSHQDDDVDGHVHCHHFEQSQFDKREDRNLKFNYWPFLFLPKIRWFALNWWTLRAFVDVDAVYRLTSPSFWHLTTNWKNLSMKHFIIFFIPVNFYRPEPSGNSILKLDSIWQIHSRLIRAHPSSKFHSYFTNKREFWLLN
jgi:hypothetical protein